MQLQVAVLGHRGKLRKIEPALDNEVFTAQLLALRLAVAATVSVLAGGTSLAGTSVGTPAYSPIRRGSMNW